LQKSGKLTSNDILSAHRSVTMLTEFSEAFLSLAQKEMKKDLYEVFYKKYQQSLSESMIFVSSIPVSLKSF
ncbi:MAG: hypothetical protein ACKO6J_00555, partial [Crocinitomicaceae bacterium]